MTISLGLGVYQGDLDRNVSGNPVEYFALAEFSLAILADRALGQRFLAEAGLVYHRFNIDAPRDEANPTAENSMGVNIFALDLTGGIRIPLFGRPSFVRVHAGIAPTMIATTYNFTTPDILESSGYEFDQTSPRFLLTFPISVVLQDAWRFGIRFTGSDFVDSAGRDATGNDVISSIHVGYRFEL
ncbi:MAG: hypothetical protein AAGG50_01210 [Bacteroidota bacterium]